MRRGSQNGGTCQCVLAAVLVSTGIVGAWSSAPAQTCGFDAPSGPGTESSQGSSSRGSSTPLLSTPCNTEAEAVAIYRRLEAPPLQGPDALTVPTTGRDHRVSVKDGAVVVLGLVGGCLSVLWCGRRRPVDDVPSEAGSEASSSTQVATPCSHQRVSRAGSNQWQKRRLCMDCGTLWITDTDFAHEYRAARAKAAVALTASGSCLRSRLAQRAQQGVSRSVLGESEVGPAGPTAQERCGGLRPPRCASTDGCRRAGLCPCDECGRLFCVDHVRSFTIDGEHIIMCGECLAAGEAAQRGARRDGAGAGRGRGEPGDRGRGRGQ
jgi:hypothetical protein